MFLYSDLKNYQKLHQRIAGNTQRKILDKAAEQSLAEGIPLVPVQVASLLFTLARVASPERIIEVGTGLGYSTLLFALASHHSGIVTVENNLRCVKVAQSFWEKAKVGGQINQVLGNSLDVLPTICGPFELAFLDAAKEEYLHCLRMLLPKLSAGAMVVADDIYFTGEINGEYLDEPIRKKITGELDQFRRYLCEQPYFITSFLQIGCGVSVTLLTGQQ